MTSSEGLSPLLSTRCSESARERRDPLAGTATQATAFLLLEDPGPWGSQALRDARLPAGLGEELERRAETAGVRPLLIRRDQDEDPARRRVFTAYVRPGHERVETTTLGDARDVLDLDLTALAAGASLGLTAHEDPVYAVCTHGRRDRCCAEIGRPVLKAVTQVAPERAWGVSHLGGHRYAANLLVLGAGLVYGNLTPRSAREVVSHHEAGQVSVEHLRGRTGWSPPEQAAEIALRRHLGLTPLDALTLVQAEGTGEQRTVTFSADGRTHVVHARAEDLGAVRQSCGDDKVKALVAWRCTVG